MPFRAPREEMKYSSTLQALTEVGLDGDLDGAAGGVGHQAAHTGQLTDLSHGAAGAGVGHHEDGVVAVHGLLQGVGHVVGGLLPRLQRTRR